MPFCLIIVIVGPFNNQEMAEWFQAGYFTMSLLVKRACDESFQPLGDIMKMWGRVPFSPGPAPPPHMVSNLCLTQNTVAPEALALDVTSHEEETVVLESN